VVEVARAAGFDVGSSTGRAVVPLIIGDSIRTVMLAERLLQQGFNAFPIIPPGVPEKSARLRLFVSAAHTADQIDGFFAAARSIIEDIEARGVSLANAARLIRR
jgi:7-keto-8-aminopelargonate synthetase-like enzyme